MDLSVLLIISYYLLSTVPTLGILCYHVMLYIMNVTMSISIGLYPKLDLWTANKLHYITLQAHTCGRKHKQTHTHTHTQTPVLLHTCTNRLIFS
jgi:hypothetical protein